MTDVTITINKKSVLSDVSMSTSYLATRNEQGNTYSRVAILEADKELIDTYYNEACNHITTTLKAHIANVTNNDTTYTATLKLSSAFNGMLAESINTALKAYCTHYILSRWYEVTDKQRSEYYFAVAKDNLTMAQRNIVHKNAPKREI